MAESKYNAVFQWPSTGPQRVIVTGNFDNWSCSVPLTKTSDGFEVSVPVPYDHEVVYKFIVDGNWIADDKKPKQYDGRGIVNNVLRTPKAPKPEPAPAPAPPTVDELASVPAIDATPEATASVTAPEILVKDQVDAQATPAPVVPEPPTAPLPIAAPNQHPVDIVPEASTASGPETVEDVKPESSLPIVEVLPAEGALPETAPVEVAATVPVVEPLPIPAGEPLAGPAKAAAIEPLLVTDKVEVPVTESIPTKDDEAITEPSAPMSVAPVQDKPTEPAPEKSDAAETGANKPGESAEGKPAARDSSEAKPHLNGVGSPKEEGSHKRSSTFGSIRSKVFPSADEEANKPENRSVSTLGKGATREKRKSILKRVTSIFKQSS